MKLLWEERAWQEYLDWQTQDKKTLKRLNSLLKDIQRDTSGGIGKPERLKGELRGCLSRRIDDANRLIYRITDGTVQILSCRGHYGDK